MTFTDASVSHHNKEIWIVLTKYVVTKGIMSKNIVSMGSTKPPWCNAPEQFGLQVSLDWSILIWVRSWNCGCLVTWFCYQSMYSICSASRRQNSATHFRCINTYVIMWDSFHILIYRIGGISCVYHCMYPNTGAFTMHKWSIVEALWLYIKIAAMLNRLEYVYWLQILFKKMPSLLKSLLSWDISKITTIL